MEIRYKFTYREAMLAQWEAWKHSCLNAPLLFSPFWGVIPLVLISWMYLSLLNSILGWTPDSGLVPVELIAIMLFTVGFCGGIGILVSGLLRTRRKLTITPEGIIYARFLSRRVLPWRAIREIEDDEAFLTLSTKWSFIETAIFILVPKRAFETPDQAQAFFDQARWLWESATADTHSPTPAEGAWPPTPRA